MSGDGELSICCNMGSEYMLAARRQVASEWVEVISVQLPGREDRVSEVALTEMSSVVDGILSEIGPFLDGPLVLFGYSVAKAEQEEEQEDSYTVHRRGSRVSVAQTATASQADDSVRPVAARGPLAVVQRTEFLGFL